MTEVYLLLGSNLNDKLKALQTAVKYLNDEVGPISEQSSIYASAPWGFKHHEEFLNQVLLINTTLTPEQLLLKILTIESIIGRIRNPDRVETYEARIIDIDILYFGNIIYNSATLEIPHPRIEQRRFALVPMCEIGGDYLHPVYNKTQNQLLKECVDLSQVSKI